MRKRKEVIEEQVEEVLDEPKVFVEEVVEEPIKEVPDYCILGTTETIEDVANKYGKTVEELIKLNGTDTFIGGNQIKVK